MPWSACIPDTNPILNPFQLYIITHTHTCTCMHKHREQKRGVGGRSWSCQREGNQSCNSRAYRGKRVSPYLTRQHAEYVNLYMNTHKKEEGQVRMHFETHMHKWWDNSLQYFWKICPRKCQDTDPSPKVSITNTTLSNMQKTVRIWRRR